MTGHCSTCQCFDSGEAFAPRPSRSSEWARKAAIQAAKEAVDEAKRKRTTVRRTPDEWSRAKGIRVLDPDGWRGDGAPDWDEPISEDEFDQRAGMSTAGRWDWASTEETAP